MILRKMKSGRKQPLGQSLVELALTLPIFLLLVLGIMEVSRLVFMYNAVFTASREGARYAAATGISTNGVPYYIDCTGIRARAQKVAILSTLSLVDITYDSGSGTAGKGSCPVGETTLVLGDRIVVKVTATYHSMIPLLNLGDIPITSTTYRTLIKDLDVNSTISP